MTKPIGYYTNTMPGDGSYLDELQQEYGSYLEGLTKTQKLVLLSHVANNMLTTEINMQGSMVVAPEVEEASYIAQNIYSKVTMGEHPGLAQALIDQVKHDRGRRL